MAQFVLVYVSPAVERLSSTSHNDIFVNIRNSIENIHLCPVHFQHVVHVIRSHAVHLL